MLYFPTAFSKNRNILYNNIIFILICDVDSLKYHCIKNDFFRVSADFSYPCIQFCFHRISDSINIHATFDVSFSVVFFLRPSAEHFVSAYLPCTRIIDKLIKETCPFSCCGIDVALLYNCRSNHTISVLKDDFKTRIITSRYDRVNREVTSFDFCNSGFADCCTSNFLSIPIVINMHHCLIGTVLKA